MGISYFSYQANFIALDNKELPPLEFITRSSSGVTFYSIKEGEGIPIKQEFFQSDSCEEVVWSRDGSLCLYREKDGVRVFDMATKTERINLKLPKVVAIDISPLNNWIVTLVPFKSEPNLQIWDCKTGELHISLIQKTFSRSNWPYIQWDSQETRSLFHAGESLFLFNGHDFNDKEGQQKISNKDKHLSHSLSIQTSTMVSLSPSPTLPAIVMFTPTRENEGILALFADRSNEPGNHFMASVVQQCMCCNFATCEWNSSGDRAVIKVSSDIDRTGVSYYGKSKLLLVQNSQDLSSSTITPFLNNEQSIQEAHFSPDGKRICILSTSLPTSSLICTADDGHLESECHKYHANTIFWAPHSHITALAGFGNMNGDIYVWDIVENKQLVRFKTDCITSCAWTADSKYMVMGTCFPRMRVDNCLYVYKYNGVKLYEEKMKFLYEIAVRPVPEGVFPLLPPTEEEMKEIKIVVKENKPKKYLPPHLRNQSKPSIPGLSSRSQNHKSGLAGVKTQSNSKQNHPKPKSESKPKPKPKPTIPKNNESPAEEVSRNIVDEIFPSSPQNLITKETLQKKIRNLTKKLKDIDQIKLKLSDINEEQLIKIAKEESIKREICDLQQQLEQMK